MENAITTLVKFTPDQEFIFRCFGYSIAENKIYVQVLLEKTENEGEYKCHQFYCDFPKQVTDIIRQRNFPTND